MIFFAGNDGSILKSIPEPVYQGAANANTVYLIAPFAAGSQVSLAFRLPNGSNYPAAGPAIMAPTGSIAGVIDEDTGAPYAGWVYDLPNPITARYGRVSVQFYFRSEAGQIVASSLASFTVGMGVPSELPEQPDDGTYDTILAHIASMQTRLDNGFYRARSICVWNAAYTYGAGEIVYYPSGEYGALVRSVKDGNVGNVPYAEGGSAWWEEVLDFSLAAECGQQASASADSAAGYAVAAQASAAAAAMSAEDADGYAEIARRYAEIGIRLNTDYETAEELPNEGSSQYIYLIPSGEGVFDQYVWSAEKQDYIMIGSTSIDTDGLARQDGDYPAMTVGKAAQADKLAHALIIQSGDESVVFDGSKAETIAISGGSGVQPSGNYPQMSVGNAASADAALTAETAAVAAKVQHAFTIVNGETTVTFDGSEARTVVLTGGENAVWATDAEVEALFAGSAAPSVTASPNSAGGTTYSITL